ncbi:MAG TPA: Crp/Fnr family transcriptional regulator [Saprospiraceae bacterium]|nr:Crp/Fnr family transcriptional regulator [Saprospiraceae bacterium]
MKIDQILDNIYPIPDSSKSMIKNLITEVTYPKGHILLRADKIVKSIYFIKKGIVRAYSSLENNEITFWFGKEGDTAISMKSYVSNEKGYEDIELLENCEFYELKTEKLRDLFEKDIHIANWGRKYAEKELIKTEERLISRQFRTASERYKELLNENPELIQRVQLGHIASYLGITQVSLSRVRAEIK